MIISLPDIHALHLSGQNEQALEKLERYLKQNPMVSKAHQLKGNILKSRREYDASQQSYLKALELDPNDYETLNSLGNLFLDVGDTDRAKIAYKSSLMISENYSAAKKNLAFLELKTSNPLTAITLFREILKDEAENQTVQLGYIQALKNSEQLEEALRVALHVKQENKSPQLDWLITQLHFELGSFDKALGLCETLLGTNEFRLSAIELKAQIHKMTGNWNDAQQFLKKVIDDPNIPFDKYGKCAEVFLQAGEKEDSIKTIHLANKINDQHALIKNTESQIYFREGQYDKAYECGLEALKLDSNNLSIKRQFALSALANERPNDAIAIAKNARSFNPYDQFWISILAIAARLIGQDHHYYYDYDKFVRVYDIEPPQGFTSVESFNADLKTALNNLHRFKNAPLNQSVRGGIQTSPNLVYNQNETIRSFFKTIDVHIRNYLNHIGFNNHHPLLKRNKNTYRFHSAWSVSLPSGGYHENHVHPEGWISSSYYVDTPDVRETDPQQKGWIKFGEPSFKHSKLTPELTIAPRPGRLVLFPSFMWHGTVPTSSKASRLTLPFDLVPD
jgi:uncharacterized protein (TIGR02466 family)